MISYGMHLSASGALTSMHRQDVITNNLANAETPGFKPDLALQIARDPARVEDGLVGLPSSDLMEMLGGGTHLLPTMVSFAQGTLDQTGQRLDVAIQGSGFFAVRDASGQGDTLRLTRDGRFTRRDDGTLVMAATGLPVLDDRQGAITLPPGPEPEIAADGTIRQNGQVVGKIGIVDVADRRALKKVDGGLFAIGSGGSDRLRPAVGSLAAGYVESAAVDEIAAMMSVASASRAVQTNLAMISYHDQMMEQAVRTFGRVG